MGEEDYQPGDKTFYHESGCVFKVEVLENSSDREWINYRLRVIEIEQNKGVTRPPEIGAEFVCMKRKGFFTGIGGLWYLMDD